MEQVIATPIITPEELVKHWQGHRGLTRRVIEAFPEQELFSFSVGGMRPFSAIVAELLAIAAPGLIEIVTGETAPLDEDASKLTTKAQLLAQWDESTKRIDAYWPQLTPERFREEHLSFGMYSNPVIKNLFYFIDNEIHHRGQGYVYLRALGIEPPPFWEH